MARIQINYPGMGNSAMDLYIPQYGDSAIHNGMTEEMFYSRKFPVLWLLQAEGENGSSWFRYSLLEEYAAQLNIAVVCPAIENSFGINVKRGDPWESFLAGSLRKVVYSMLPISDRREDNFIAGISMGGYAAIRLALKYPELFEAAGSLNGIVELDENLLSYWWNQTQLEYVFGSVDEMRDEDYKLEKLASAAQVKPEIYLNCIRENRQYMYNKKLFDYLEKEKYMVSFDEMDSGSTDLNSRNMQLKKWLTFVSELKR